MLLFYMIIFAFASADFHELRQRFSLHRIQSIHRQRLGQIPWEIIAWHKKAYRQTFPKGKPRTSKCLTKNI